jgi:uncharacterized membrane protein YfcA
MSSTVLIAMAIAGAGGVISGLAGFGFGLVVVPVLLLLYPPVTVTAVAVSLSLSTGWVVLLGTWRSVQLRTVLALAPGATIGVVLGTLLIRTLEPAVIKLIAGSVVVLFSLSVLRGWKVNGSTLPWPPRWLGWPAAPSTPPPVCRVHRWCFSSPPGTTTCRRFARASWRTSTT